VLARLGHVEVHFGLDQRAVLAGFQIGGLYLLARQRCRLGAGGQCGASDGGWCGGRGGGCGGSGGFAGWCAGLGEGAGTVVAVAAIANAAVAAALNNCLLMVLILMFLAGWDE
jgi:hypothetical protein